MAMDEAKYRISPGYLTASLYMSTPVEISAPSKLLAISLTSPLATSMPIDSLNSSMTWNKDKCLLEVL
jgi:hypothetical protein